MSKIPSATFLLFFLMMGSSSALGLEKVASSESIYNDAMAWTDSDGSSVQLSQWKGHKVVLALVYTSCKVSCPLVMRHLMSIAKKSDSANAPASEIVFVTIDPVKDTVSRLSKFRLQWNISDKNWHFLRGSVQDTRHLADRIGFKFNDDEGHIFHDDKIVVLDKDGRVSQTITGWDSATDENIN